MSCNNPQCPCDCKEEKECKDCKGTGLTPEGFTCFSCDGYGSVFFE